MLRLKQDDLDMGDLWLGALRSALQSIILSQQKQLVRIIRVGRDLEAVYSNPLLQVSVSQVLALQSLFGELNVCYSISNLGAWVSWVF